MITKYKNKINVKLKCGYSVDFYVYNLSDSEYINRAKRIKKQVR